MNRLKRFFRDYSYLYGPKTMLSRLKWDTYTGTWELFFFRRGGDPPSVMNRRKKYYKER